MKKSLELPYPNPVTTAERCRNLKYMDEYFDTPKASPLHHDNRCPLMYKELL